MEAVANPDGKASKQIQRMLGPHLRLTGGHIPYSPGARAKCLSELYAMVFYHGLPSFFVTISPSDMDAVLIIELCKNQATPSATDTCRSTNLQTMWSLRSPSLPFVSHYISLPTGPNYWPRILDTPLKYSITSWKLSHRHFIVSIWMLEKRNRIRQRVNASAQYWEYRLGSTVSLRPKAVDLFMSIRQSGEDRLLSCSSNWRVIPSFLDR